MTGLLGCFSYFIFVGVFESEYIRALLRAEEGVIIPARAVLLAMNPREWEMRFASEAFYRVGLQFSYHKTVL